MSRRVAGGAQVVAGWSLSRFRRAASLAWRPLTLLVLQAVLVTAFLASQGRLELQSVPDTGSYREAARAASLGEALSHYRTVGYPLLIRAVSSLASSWAPIPWIQLLSWLAATSLFYRAVGRFFGSRWLALAMASPLLYASLLGMVNQAQPDFLAASFVVACLALALLVAMRPGSRWLWAGLGLAVLASYHLRPAYVFLIGFAPVMAAVARFCAERLAWRDLMRWTAGLALVTTLPFVAHAGLRWLTVGHFGLVSFGGTNLAGVTASFLDDAVVRELPQKSRRMARSMLRLRRQRGWTPYRLGAESISWFEQYSDNLWKVALVSAQEDLKRRRRAAAARGEQPSALPLRIERNQLLNEFGRDVIRLRPLLYGKWVTDAFVYGARKLPGEGWVLWPFVLLIPSLVIERFVSRPPAEGSAAADTGRRLAGLAAIAVGFFLGYLALLSLVSFPFERYFVGAVIFLPSTLCAMLFVLWRRILTAW